MRKRRTKRFFSGFFFLSILKGKCRTSEGWLTFNKIKFYDEEKLLIPRIFCLAVNFSRDFFTSYGQFEAWFLLTNLIMFQQQLSRAAIYLRGRKKSNGRRTESLQPWEFHPVNVFQLCTSCSNISHSFQFLFMHKTFVAFKMEIKIPNITYFIIDSNLN